VIWRKAKGWSLKCEIFKTHNLELSAPVGNKNIGVAGAPIIAVTAEHDLFSVGAEHGKGIEPFIAADLL